MNPFAHLSESLSASRIGTYLRCPLRYWFQYVEKRPWEKVSGALVLGSAVDEAAKEAVLLVKQGWERPHDLEVENIFDRFFQVELDARRAPIAWGARKDEESTRALGRALMASLKDTLLTEERLERIVETDVSFTVPLLDDDGQPLLDTPLIGIFDFVEEIDGKRLPLELKTASNRTQYLPGNLARDPQGLIYGLAAQTLQGDDEARVRYVSAVKLKKPEIVESDFRVNADQLRWIRMVVVKAKNAIDAGHFYPTPSVMNCGGCPFAEACAKAGNTVGDSPRSLFNGNRTNGVTRPTV